MSELFDKVKNQLKFLVKDELQEILDYSKKLLKEEHGVNFGKDGKEEKPKDKTITTTGFTTT